MLTTLTSKGQATIPVNIRKKLGLKSGQKIYFEERGSEVVIRTPPLVSSLKGSLQSSVTFNKKRARQAVARMLAKRYENPSR